MCTSAKHGMSPVAKVSDPGDQGVIIVTPCVKGGFLISCGKWMYVYMYMKNMPNANVTSQKKIQVLKVIGISL